MQEREGGRVPKEESCEQRGLRVVVSMAKRVTMPAGVAMAMIMGMVMIVMVVVIVSMFVLFHRYAVERLECLREGSIRGRQELTSAWGDIRLPSFHGREGARRCLFSRLK